MRSRLVVFVVFIFSVLSQRAVAQNGCDHTAWMKSLPAHTQRTPEIFPPVLRDTTFTVNRSPRRVSIPQGFTISQFAQVSQCRGLCLSPDGVLYATSYNSGRIYALPDHNHDGGPDSTIVLTQWLNNPHGIGFYNGAIYFSDEAGFYKGIVAPNSRIITNKTQIATFPNSGHVTRNFVIDSANRRILVQVGSASNMDVT